MAGLMSSRQERAGKLCGGIGLEDRVRGELPYTRDLLALASMC